MAAPGPGWEPASGKAKPSDAAAEEEEGGRETRGQRSAASQRGGGGQTRPPSRLFFPSPLGFFFLLPPRPLFFSSRFHLISFVHNFLNLDLEFEISLNLPPFVAACFYLWGGRLWEKGFQVECRGLNEKLVRWGIKNDITQDSCKSWPPNHSGQVDVLMIAIVFKRRADFLVPVGDALVFRSNMWSNRRTCC